MKKHIKRASRIACILLSLLMVLSGLSLSVMAQEAVLADISVTINTGASVTLKDNDGDSYYDIGNSDELYAFAAAVNGGKLTINGELVADIVVNEGVMNGNTTDARVWTPIGAVNDVPLGYSGSFNGNNKTVSGLYHGDSFVDYVGLFGHSKGIICNVGVINSYLCGSHYVGAVAGKNESSVYSCYNESTVAGGQQVGGVVGSGENVSGCSNNGSIICNFVALNRDENGNIIDNNFYNYAIGGVVGLSAGTLSGCENRGIINSQGDRTGGVVGDSTQSMDCEYLTNSGKVICSGDYVGGVSGYYNSLYYCENYGEVKGADYVGGTGGRGNTINMCENSGNVKGVQYVGGISGEGTYYMDHAYNSGNVEGEAYVGGVAGKCGGYDIADAENSGSVKGKDYTGGVLGYSSSFVATARNKGETVIGENYVGGIVGYCERDILRCSYNYADVTGTQYVGGIAGKACSDLLYVYNTGSVTGENYAGGLAGSQLSYIITDSFNAGAVTGSDYVGGIAGEIDLQNLITGNTEVDSELNVFYLEGCAENADGEDQGGAGVFYEYNAENEKTELDETPYLTEASAGDFASGKLAYTLQNAQPDEYEGVMWSWYEWGQNVDNSNVADPYPSFNGATVYEVVNCIGIADGYSNTYGKNSGHSLNDSGVCKNCYALKEGEVAGVAGYNLSLSDNLGVNYYVALDDTVLEDEDAKMVFTVGEGDEAYTIEKPLSEAVAPAVYSGSSSLYILTCDVSAKEVTARISAKLVANDVEKEFADYSVMNYAESILANPDKYKNEIPLVKAMLNYSASAQVYFGYNTDDLANNTEYMTDEDRYVPSDADLSRFEISITGSTSGVEYYGSTLLLESETGINHYFIVDDDVDVENLTITVDGEAAELVANGDLYVVKIRDIYVCELDKMFEVEVGDIHLEYGVFSYGYAAMKTNKELLRNTVCALYDYYLAATEY